MVDVEESKDVVWKKNEILETQENRQDKSLTIQGYPDETLSRCDGTEGFSDLEPSMRISTTTDALWNELRRIGIYPKTKIEGRATRI